MILLSLPVLSTDLEHEIGTPILGTDTPECTPKSLLLEHVFTGVWTAGRRLSHCYNNTYAGAEK